MKIEEATILVVDDELELLEIFGAWLGRKGSKVFTAPNGLEALKILKTQPIDVLITDIRMPIMDGVTLVRHLYELESPPPCILFVSGYGNISRREIHGLGVETLLDKPLSRQALLNALDQCLMDSVDKWLTPLVEPVSRRVSLSMESLDDALESCSFGLGRGGCCVACPIPLKEDSTIDLSIRFNKEGLCLRVQATVVWVEGEQGKVGVAFNYLDPECREWVLNLIKDRRPRSFIPQCGGVK